MNKSQKSLNVVTMVVFGYGEQRKKKQRNNFSNLQILRSLSLSLPFLANSQYSYRFVVLVDVFVANKWRDRDIVMVYDV